MVFLYILNLFPNKVTNKLFIKMFFINNTTLCSKQIDSLILKNANTILIFRL